MLEEPVRGHHLGEVLMLQRSTLWTAFACAATGLGTQASAAEVAAHVVSIGTCWTGYNAAIVTMDNGDHLYLGDISTDVVMSRYVLAVAAQATQQLIYYQVSSSSNICGETRGSPDWWVQGGSIY